MRGGWGRVFVHRSEIPCPDSYRLSNELQSAGRPTTLTHLSTRDTLILVGAGIIGLIAAIVLRRLRDRLVVAVVSVLDLLFAVLALVLALLSFRLRVLRLLVRSVVAPVFGPPRSFREP
jgi:hypothetical protein